MLLTLVFLVVSQLPLLVLFLRMRRKCDWQTIKKACLMCHLPAGIFFSILLPLVAWFLNPLATSLSKDNLLLSLALGPIYALVFLSAAGYLTPFGDIFLLRKMLRVQLSTGDGFFIACINFVSLALFFQTPLSEAIRLP